ncbi:unnamed protein product [Closterium sp. NIES-54]
MQKVPDAVRDGDADSGLLAMSALCWVVRRMDLLTCALRRSVTSMDKVNVSGSTRTRMSIRMITRIRKRTMRIVRMSRRRRRRMRRRRRRWWWRRRRSSKRGSKRKRSSGSWRKWRWST